jgi:signal transduction histidine kinase/CheY-like chemotaxis protein/HPt (histidine-containing phosphotransfer) domain-containing protein
MSTQPHTTNWEKNWGSSIAIKITAPILWGLVAIGLIVTTVVQTNIEEKIDGLLKADADRISYMTSVFLIDSDGQSQTQLQEMLASLIEDTEFVAGDIQFDDGTTSSAQSEVTNTFPAGKNSENTILFGYSFGSDKSAIAEITRLVPYSNSANNTVYAELHLYHPTVDRILVAKRKKLLMQIGIPFLLFGLVLAGLIHLVVTKPIYELVNATKAVSEGDMSLRLTTERQDEYGHLAEFFNHMLEHLESKQKALTKALTDAEAASQAKSTFLANMSHEIRTPLTAIIGFSDMLKEGRYYNQETRHEIDSIIRAGKHLQEIINDILDLSKIEAGQLEIELIEDSPIEIMHQVDELIRPRAEEKGLNFKTVYNFPLPKIIKTDPTRLRQVLLNLLSNAVKFTNEGDVEVIVEYLQQEKQLRFTVIDAGIGMTEVEMRRIFKPFTQGDTSTTRQYGGTGLGLCISQQLANKLGGNITCSSKKGAGSKFVFTASVGDLPNVELAVEEYVVESKPKKAKFVLPHNSLSGSVLLAEDTADNQRLISMYLRRAGVSVEVVENGQQALQKALQYEYDLILMDMQMPIMGGVEAIEKLRVAGYKKPIVTLTANALKQDRERCAKAGADDYLTKPLDLEPFYVILKTYLREPEQTKPVVSPAYVTDDLLDDPEFKELVNKFLEDLPDKLQNINEAYRDHNWSAMKSLIHKLKGTGASFGYPAITELATLIYKDLLEDNYTALEHAVADLNKICQSIFDQQLATQQTG